MEGIPSDYKPLVLTETSSLTQEEWRQFRKKGIGGSDAAAVMGLSPFVTARDLFYDKTDQKPPNENELENNWVALKVGNLLEDLVAEIFAFKTGYKLIKMPKMFCHPLYPFMLANIDYLVELPDGTIAILECKTTSYFSKDKWDNNSIPVNYEIQGRHYMCVMNINKVFYACLYGNSENQFLMRELDRDYACESELIFEEQMFWNDYVLKKQFPPFMEEPELVAACLEKYTGTADRSLPGVMLDISYEERLAEYLRLKDEKAAASKAEKELNEQMKREVLPIIESMGKSCKGFLTSGEDIYEISYTPSGRTAISKENLERLKYQHPAIYREYAAVSETRSFTVKVLDKKKAAA